MEKKELGQQIIGIKANGIIYKKREDYSLDKFGFYSYNGSNNVEITLNGHKEITEEEIKENILEVFNHPDITTLITNPPKDSFVGRFKIYTYKDHLTFISELFCFDIQVVYVKVRKFEQIEKLDNDKIGPTGF